jgi:hypothetical protein
MNGRTLTAIDIDYARSHARVVDVVKVSYGSCLSRTFILNADYYIEPSMANLEVDVLHRYKLILISALSLDGSQLWIF